LRIRLDVCLKHTLGACACRGTLRGTYLLVRCASGAAVPVPSRVSRGLEPGPLYATCFSAGRRAQQRQTSRQRPTAAAFGLS